MGRPQALVLVDYFGFPFEPPLETKKELVSHFTLIIRDCAHSLPCAGLDEIRGSEGGYHVYSLRKPLPIPDLALVTVGDSTLSDKLKSSARPVERTIFTMFEALSMAFAPMRSGQLFRHMRQMLMASNKIGISPSHLSIALAGRLDHRAVMDARKANALRLMHALEPWSLFKSLPKASCPYYFPIIVPDPGRVQQLFLSRGIETTTFWSLDERFIDRRFPVAKSIARSILCLPVHQDLTESQIGDVIEAAEAGLN
jgi:dTDP-4-amino-4,6-dideoxygalactose transaminase